ncbi:Ribosome biogenesis protein NSA2 [Zea mays]|uniref:Ribosome biogenesis protein NSA2 n=1 Tax=Zea mays TaxID=4577 RepID=A0A3L6FVU0_MAIZE|nr:Ribosome biogenesis protein NSA2 [Zea mays]
MARITTRLAATTGLGEYITQGTILFVTSTTQCILWGTLLVRRFCEGAASDACRQGRGSCGGKDQNNDEKPLHLVKGAFGQVALLSVLGRGCSTRKLSFKPLDSVMGTLRILTSLNSYNRVCTATLVKWQQQSNANAHLILTYKCCCKSACTCSSSWTGSCNARSMGCRLIVYHYCLSVLVPTNIQHIVAFSGNASQGGTTLPMIYVLGDSLAPVKNNNNLVTLLKANFLRNNIDYLGHKATGCFSNGKNSIDFLGTKKVGEKQGSRSYHGASCYRQRGSSLNNSLLISSRARVSLQPQGDHIELHQKRHGKHLDHELIGTKGKRFVKKRYAEKAQMKKT